MSMNKIKQNNSTQLKSDERDGKAHQNDDKLDGGFGWIIVIASFFIFFISAGELYSFGVIYTHLLNEFKESKGYTSCVLSLMSALGSLTGPIVSVFVKKYGCRKVAITGAILCTICLFVSAFATNVFTLILTIGIGVGFGFGLIWLPPIVIVSTYFEKKRSLATGISLAGSGLGTFVFVPIVTYLCDEYGWRKTLMILAGLVLNCGFFAILYRPFNLPDQPNPENFDAWQRKLSKQTASQQNDCLKQMKVPSEKNESKSMGKSLAKMMNLSLLKDPVFILFNLADFSISLGYYVPYFCLADLVKMIGMSSENASHLLSVIGIVNTMGRVVIGFLSDKSFINRLGLFNICVIVCGTATAMSFLCFDYNTFIIYSAIYGFTSGAYIALRSVILTDLFGLEKLEGAYGLTLMFEGTANFLGPIIVGHLYDQSFSYTPGFLFAGIVIAFGGLSLFAMSPLQMCVKRRQLKEKFDHI